MDSWRPWASSYFALPHLAVENIWSGDILEDICFFYFKGKLSEPAVAQPQKKLKGTI